MNEVTNLFLIFVAVLGFNTILLGQIDHAQQDESKDQSPWEITKEAYHEIMSSTFHPAEEGNFGPIKAKAKDLVAKAKE